MMDFSTFWQDFHFLRPYFLLAMPFGLGFFYTLRHRVSGSSSWKSVIDANLLTHLIEQPENNPKKTLHVISLFIAWIIACFALAGPAWQRVPQIAEENQNVLIIILDLSLSMYAEDQKPSRIINAKRKITDILAARKDGLTALLVYSGDAHIVTPLTNDTETIATLVPVLEPNMMPKIGTNLGSALIEAENILLKSGNKKADVFLLTDEITTSQFPLLENLSQKNLHLSLLTFGTNSGAPIPVNKGFLKTSNGDTVIAKLNWDDIQDFATDNNLLAVQSNFDDGDIRQLLNNLSISEETQESERIFDLWEDAGHWLTILLIPFLLFNFRRGWILLVFLVVLPDNSYAMGWEDLWHTKNQQAAEAFQRDDTQTAANTFTDPQWKAVADYKNGDYETALEGFRQDSSAQGFYNRGNALAKTGQLNDAITAYEEALKKQADFADAEFNLALVKKLLEQQEQQKQDQESSGQEQQQDQEQKEQEQNAGQHQEGDSQNQDQQNAGQQNNEQQNNSGQSAENTAPQDQPSSESPDSEQQTPGDKGQASAEEKKQLAESSAEESEKNGHDQAMQQAQKEDADTAGDAQAAQTGPELTPQEKEQQQALQQWLRKIPDDPGQLLRNKFRYQYENNRNQNEHIDKDSEQLW